MTVETIVCKNRPAPKAPPKANPNPSVLPLAAKTEATTFGAPFARANRVTPATVYDNPNFALKFLSAGVR